MTFASKNPKNTRLDPWVFPGAVSTGRHLFRVPFSRGIPISSLGGKPWSFLFTLRVYYDDGGIVSARLYAVSVVIEYVEG